MAQGGTVERRSEWKFVITDQGWLWAVTRPDGSEQRAQRPFTTLKQAADAAMQHGYASWKFSERRQVRN
jgi:hypothetical protein